MPLPEDRGLNGDGRTKVRRFRRYQLELGERLAAFRARYGITQAEIARAIGASGGPTVSLWESRANVPDGMLRERLAELLDGQCWPALRVAMIANIGDRLPTSWERAVRWYRRASRERRSRETSGVEVVTILGELRAITTIGELLRHYRGHDGDWALSIIDRRDYSDASPTVLRQIEDAAYGLRWLELAHGRQFDLGQSLVPQLPLTLLDDVAEAP